MSYEVDVKVARIIGNLFAHPIRRDDLAPAIFQFHFSDDEAAILCGAFVDLPFELPVLDDVAGLFDERLDTKLVQHAIGIPRWYPILELITNRRGGLTLNRESRFTTGDANSDAPLWVDRKVSLYVQRAGP